MWKQFFQISGRSVWAHFTISLQVKMDGMFRWRRKQKICYKWSTRQIWQPILTKDKHTNKRSSRKRLWELRLVLLCGNLKITAFVLRQTGMETQLVSWARQQSIKKLNPYYLLIVNSQFWDCATINDITKGLCQCRSMNSGRCSRRPLARRRCHTVFPPFEAGEKCDEASSKRLKCECFCRKLLSNQLTEA